MNQALEGYLRCFVNGKPSQWAKWLHWAETREYCYNTSPHMSTKMTHFHALYGRDPPSLIRYKQESTTVDTLLHILHERDATIDDLRAHLIKAQQRLKCAADKHRRDLELNVGDMVYLRSQAYRQQSLAK